MKNIKLANFEISNKNNFILGDVFAIKEKGVEDLSNNYYWPVSDKKFKDFVKFTHYEYKKILNLIENDDIRNIAIVELSFVAKLQQLLHYNYLKITLKKVPIFCL